ncbi:DnaJ sub C member 9, partial [Blyttiomyces sp. JEL0837]
KTLDVPQDATPKTIKDRYISISLECHPDRISSSNLSEKEKQQRAARFLAVKLAYDVLKNAEARRDYDAMLDLREGRTPNYTSARPSSDFSAWSTASGVPSGWEAYKDEVLREKQRYWPFRRSDSDDDSVDSSWWAASAGMEFESAASTKKETKAVLFTLLGVWTVTISLIGGSLLYYYIKIDSDPALMVERNAKHRENSDRWLYPSWMISGATSSQEFYPVTVNGQPRVITPNGTLITQPVATRRRDIEKRKSQTDNQHDEFNAEGETGKANATKINVVIDSRIIENLNAAHRRQWTVAQSALTEHIQAERPVNVNEMSAEVAQETESK